MITKSFKHFNVPRFTSPIGSRISLGQFISQGWWTSISSLQLHCRSCPHFSRKRKSMQSSRLKQDFFSQAFLLLRLLRPFRTQSHRPFRPRSHQLQTFRRLRSRSHQLQAFRRLRLIRLLQSFWTRSQRLKTFLRLRSFRMLRPIRLPLSFRLLRPIQLPRSFRPGWFGLRSFRFRLVSPHLMTPKFANCRCAHSHASKLTRVKPRGIMRTK